MKRSITIFLIINLSLLGVLNSFAYADKADKSLSSSAKPKTLTEEKIRQRLASGALFVICGIAMFSWGSKNLEAIPEKSYSNWGQLFFDVFASPAVVAGALVVGYKGLEAMLNPSQAEKDYVGMLQLDSAEREVCAAKTLNQSNKSETKKERALAQEEKVILKPFNYDEMRFMNQRDIDLHTQTSLKNDILPKIEEGRLWGEPDFRNSIEEASENYQKHKGAN